MVKVKFPYSVSVGSVEVKIYRTPSHGCESYTVSYWLAGQRRRLVFADFGRAKQEAEAVAAKMSRGDAAALTLTARDREVYVRAMELVNPIGVPLDLAALQFVEAHKKLGGVSLDRAVDFYVSRHPMALPRKTVGEAVGELIEAKRVDGMSKVYIKDLAGRLGKFSAAFQCQLAAVSVAQINEFLRSLKCGGRSRNNYRMAIHTLFRFGERRGYLSRQHVDPEQIDKARETQEEIEIFTPGELRELLEVARPEMVPWLAIAGFAGLRSAELQRLDWSEVNLAERHIEIKASKAKTAARRLVPVADNLAAWLAPHAKPAGQVTGFESWWNQIPRLVEAVNAQRKASAEQAAKKPGAVDRFIWKHNGLRHSFCSYRVAAVKNVAQVALEAGNSPQMIFANYRQLVSEAEATKWFSILPEGQSNIIPLQAAGGR
ncbi:MAG: hypothetical protein ACYDH9_14060 [Limisphaerales bacterium]